jgi:Fic family protein
MPKVPFDLPGLPPQIDYTTLIPLLTSARDAVARYDEVVKRLPNPDLIRRTFATQEAVLSSQIEGTQATLEEVLELDASEANGEENEKLKDYREISNYRKAIKTGRSLLSERPLSENVIKDLHRVLLDSVRGKNKQPGEFRTHQVHIGPPGATLEEATYVPPAHAEIPRLFSNLVNYLHNEEVPDPLIQVAVAHYQFEAIHPFSDGNGRVGRLLIPLFLYEKGITAYPNLYLSEFLENHRRDYYAMLNGVSERGEWVFWIEFFLRAIREQAKKSQERAEKVERLYRELHVRLPEFNSRYASVFLEDLFSSPVFTAQSIGRYAKINNKQTLYTLIEKFVKAGIVTVVDPTKGRNRVFIFEPLLKILE